jgi:hypothetical protein
VIEVAEEFVEAVVGWQHVVHVAQVVLAELSRGIPLFLQQRRNRHDLLVHPDRARRDAHLGETGAIGALPRDEGRAAAVHDCSP